MSGGENINLNSRTEEGTEKECRSACGLDSCNVSQQNAPVEEVGQKDPEVGMMFQTWNDAYDFYGEYAKNVGFSVRIQGGHKLKSGVYKDRIFVCSFEGHRAFDKRRVHVKYRRDNRRTGCKAQLTIALQANGKYHVTKFEGTHNHMVLNPRISQLLKSNGKTALAHSTQADSNSSSTLPKSTLILPKPTLILPKTSFSVMDKQVRELQNLGASHAAYNNCLYAKRKRDMEKEGEQVREHRDLGVVHDDYDNYLKEKRKREMEKGGAGAILKYFEKLQEENRLSFHSIQLDAMDQITNIFWADARMVADYNYFGDVISFDTSFRTNDEERLFATFVGVNNHKQIVVFGAALLYDETVESFKWVFQSFLRAMSGKQPITILTDKDAAITHAIEHVFPKTSHRFCIWHIYQNAANHLQIIFATSSFQEDFRRCIYEYEEEGEFLRAWNDMLIKYDLKENVWLQELFEVKEKWALAYGRNHFCADIVSTQRSGSMNMSLKGYLKSTLDLFQIFNHFERVVADYRLKELEMDVKMSQSTPHLPFPIQMLRQAASIYTPTIYRVFEKEYSESLDCVIQNKFEVGTKIEYIVKYCNGLHKYVVAFDPSNITVVCSCKKFEFSGIICSHSLYVLLERQVKQLPSQYILKRWTRNAKDGAVTDYRGCTIELEPNVRFSMMFRELQRVSRETSARAAEDKRSFLFLLDVYKHARQRIEEILKSRSSVDFGLDFSFFY
ncbi:PREDICTED: protein FAR1-RELATED SEQUENCE 12-like [Nelumbo nucifera]|uniref:Protein FAR1-RELATED SEQUENCE n=1 Tax=Nelumbo nucifera TaxID=4432 RepID=A0A1U8AMG6_NELNU|nr:PREDICTED: protein FAR1-RELATED SEQUENCE 12-like [Nelumbo nucifera]XP_010269019.1 PREDICTED: protein FAR1-RELATED SEQUENCE 12-like [Nelumbo nucifera]XP_010269020.1 PREDICTED: protein FAR1-RELATED SEQUENCE 12-like [Nelumbo nucifera]XP_010269021.1 PREDICTED: protein FAR1-RELATED SEQUENCE 12-like [Nelumbo nucifera]XP_019054735.1 PREDICTED: protein FAR1-RELATED SEQUENCE 12-like [Nelumbo nucifera]